MGRWNGIGWLVGWLVGGEGVIFELHCEIMMKIKQGGAGGVALL